MRQRLCSHIGFCRGPPGPGIDPCSGRCKPAHLRRGALQRGPYPIPPERRQQRVSGDRPVAVVACRGAEAAVARRDRVGQERGGGGRRHGVHRRRDRRQAVGPGPRSRHRRHPLETPAAAQTEHPFRTRPGDLAGRRRGPRLLHPVCDLSEGRVGDAWPDRVPEDRRHRTVAGRPDVLGHRGLDAAGRRRHAVRGGGQPRARRPRGARQADRRAPLVRRRPSRTSPRTRRTGVADLSGRRGDPAGDRGDLRDARGPGRACRPRAKSCGTTRIRPTSSWD